MHSIRQNYGSTSPSDSDDDDTGDDNHYTHGARSSSSPYTTAQPLPPAPVAVTEAPLPFAGRARRPRPPAGQDDARAFEFSAYQPKRRRRQQRQSGGDAAAVPGPLGPPTLVDQDATVDGVSVFEGVEEVADTATCIRPRGRGGFGRTSGRLTPVNRLRGHLKAVSSLQWNPRFPSLALSASMDATVRVWDVSERRSRRVLRPHGASLGVKSARWSLDGRHALSGGYDGRAVYADVETGSVVRAFAFPIDVSGATSDTRPPSSSGQLLEAVTSVNVHPLDRDWVVVGTSRGGIHSFDLREPSGRPAQSFTRAFAQVHDLLFLSSSAGGDSDANGGDVRLVSSADVTRRDASNQTLLVWDFRSSTLLFDRLDQDMHAFQCLRKHPTRTQFVAQSSADCAALFSSVAPYKRVRRKRPATVASSASGKFAAFSGGHQVAGYAIQCSFSPDGALFATGDAAGRLILYNDASGSVVQSVRLNDARTPVISAEFSPLPVATSGGEAALVTGSYDGSIDVLRFQHVDE